VGAGRRRGSIASSRTDQHQQGLRVNLAGNAEPQGGAKCGADIGIALDGDADRVILVDERGHVAMATSCGGDRAKLEGLRVSPSPACRHGDVESGARTLPRRQGLQMIAAPVGDRYVLEQMLKAGLQLRRRAVGHIILSELPTTATASSRHSVLGRGAKAPPSGVGSRHRFRPPAQILKNGALRSGKRSTMHVKSGSSMARNAQRPRPSLGPLVRHRARDPRDGRGRRPDPGRGSVDQIVSALATPARRERIAAIS